MVSDIQKLLINVSSLACLINRVTEESKVIHPQMVQVKRLIMGLLREARWAWGYEKVR